MSLLIKNGRVVDGSGIASFHGDVAVKNGKIVEIGKLSGAADAVVDVSADLGAGDDQWTMTTGDSREPSANAVALHFLKIDLHGGDGADTVNMALRRYEDGEVLVSGFAKDATEKSEAERIASETPGVKRVRSEIVVRQ